MNDELAEVIRDVLIEALERYDTEYVRAAEELERVVRCHFLDRWYRFTPFGVTTRRDLESLRVEVKWVQRERLPEWAASEIMPLACATTVIVKGTPLEGRAS